MTSADKKEKRAEAEDDDMTMRNLLQKVWPARRDHQGMSLIELGLVMVIISMALVPVVQMIGGPRSSSGNGTADRIIGQKTKELTLANSIIEEALAANYDKFACGSATFNPGSSTSGFPQEGKFKKLPAAPCLSNAYSTQKLYYQWSVRNMDSTGKLPEGNHYYSAVLNVWNGDTTGEPLLSLPTSFFWNSSGGSSKSNKTGIVLIQDVSGSMAAGSGNGPWSYAVSGASSDLASPYLKYRYKDGSYDPGNTIALDLNKDKELDIISLLDVDDPDTDRDETYFHPGSLKLPACSNQTEWKKFLYTSYNWTPVNALCNTTKGPNDNNWKKTLDESLSRLEASRSSLFTFLLATEANPELYQNVKLGLFTFSDNAKLIVPLEDVDTSNRYSNMRRKISWINRSGPNMIGLENMTNMYAGLESGATLLYNDNTLNSRIILLVGDGEPTVGKQNLGDFKTLAQAIGNGTFNNSNGTKKTTIFTLGVLDKDAEKFLKAIASQTPGGQYFYAKSIGDMQPIFAQIQYQIQLLVLLNKSSRYNLDFTPKT